MTKEEAIEVYNGLINVKIKEAFEFFAPELRESEDERIRKDIIEHFRYEIEELFNKGEEYEAEIEELSKYVAYLEKQKHSLNFDAISSWLRDRASRYVNSEYNEFHHCTEYDGTINVERLIADLKVAVDSGTFDIREQKEQIEEDLSTRLNGVMQEYVKAGKDEEEQEHRLKCYQLFWDALSDSEFFKQKEQKPVDDGARTKIISRATSEKQVVLVSESDGNAEIGWDTRSLEDAKNLLEYGISFINKQLGVKPAEWSENDKRILNELLDHCNTENAAWYNFLKSLRPQPKQEWNEEDEQMRRNLMSLLANVRGDRITETAYQKYYSWLKSLRPSWKPSEEQIIALEKAIIRVHSKEEIPILCELRQQLKKLM